MKTTLKVNVPEPGAIASGLDVATIYPTLATAEQRLDAAEQQLEEARANLRDASDLVRSLPALIQRGERPTVDLEAAIAKERAAALLLPEREAAVTKAQESVSEHRRQARAAVLVEATKRRDELQAVADQLRPALEALRAAERALFAGIATHAAEPHDARERLAARALGTVPAGLTWPLPVDTELQLEDAIGDANRGSIQLQDASRTHGQGHRIA